MDQVIFKMLNETSAPGHAASADEFLPIFILCVLYAQPLRVYRYKSKFESILRVSTNCLNLSQCFEYESILRFEFESILRNRIDSSEFESIIWIRLNLTRIRDWENPGSESETERIQTLMDHILDLLPFSTYFLNNQFAILDLKGQIRAIRFWGPILSCCLLHALFLLWAIRFWGLSCRRTSSRNENWWLDEIYKFSKISMFMFLAISRS